MTVLKASELQPPLKVTRITRLEERPILQDFFARCGGIFGWDIETTPLKDYFFRRCRTFQFGNQTEQYVIDLLGFCDGDSDLLFRAQGNYGANLHLAPKLAALISTLAPILCSQEYLKVGVTLSFEYMSFYWLFGMRTFHFFDCSVVEKCIWAGAHSMKDYGYYSMEEMMERYFKVHIDKTLQESFTLDLPLTDEQCEYAALDTRFPLAIQTVQSLILQGWTIKSLESKGKYVPQPLRNTDPIVLGDNLDEIARIENDAIGAFQDMYIHGERTDRPRWQQRVDRKKRELAKLFRDELDPIFLPIVGNKNENVTDDQIEAAKATWKAYGNPSDEEIKLKGAIRLAAKAGNTDEVTILSARREALEVARKAKKEELKEVASKLGKKRTRLKNLAAKSEGQALINYGSDAQLLAILKGMKGLARVTNLEDETLEKFERFPVMAAIRKYHGLAKEIGTYGDQWAMEWKTKPCKEEGWLHPGDGRLHSIYNQQDAATGRSSSEKPNGQNIPQDKEYRECFIADPPDESIRISTCCDADTEYKFNSGNPAYLCTQCRRICETKPEEYVIITADMSGAELRIIAELANDPIWIEAFNRGEDVHSVGTELLYEEEWPKFQYAGQLIKDKKTGAMVPYWCEYYKLHTEDTVKRFSNTTVGHPMRQKCQCPEHGELRNDNKSTNFLIAYGGGPYTLAIRIKKSKEQAKALMERHRGKFPRIWDYLDESGRMAKILKKAFDMFGRRRIFPEPTQERARIKAMEDREERLRFPEEEAKHNIETFINIHKRKPTDDELWHLKHRQPTQKEISNAFMALHSSIERQGKNHCIQGTNATIAKLAMSCAFDKDGKPYLWHTLPLYKAILLKFVHDELVAQCPKRFALKVKELIGDAFKRAAATKMHRVVMEFDAAIAAYWKK